MRIDDGTPAPVEAATVMLVRGNDEIEVFMLERHLESDFVGGAYVFPGGKIDPSDTALPEALVSGSPPADLVAAVGRELARGLAVAAIRETFEEAGVLLGKRQGSVVTAELLATESFVYARSRLAERHSTWSWIQWLADEQIALDLDALAWWSWWVTPEGVHRRFDTKFFLAKLPADQHALHDNIETTDSRWTQPATALAAAASGEVSIIFPTRRNLQQLATHNNPTNALQAAQAPNFERPRIQPEISTGDDGALYVDHPSFDGPQPV